MEDIHEYEKKLEQMREKVKNGSLRLENKKVLLDFENHLILKNVGSARRLKYFYMLQIFCRKVDKDFRNIDVQDIKDFISSIQKTSLSEWTKHSYKVIVKRFFYWFKGNDEEYPAEVKWIKATFPKNKQKLPNE
ncbi:hypothetical protein HZA97_09015 [Candidatus Woesearchaeota archaeon]|nr:hypothetical protein [Candidatus Woesearchaeota archaeon]